METRTIRENLCGLAERHVTTCRHAQMEGGPECIASADKGKERAGSGTFTKMESEREQSKRFARDKFLFLCY